MRPERVCLTLVCLFAACAHRPVEIHRAKIPSAAPPISQRVKLAILPVESDEFPQLASLLNGSLQALKLTRVDEYDLPKVTLETAQLAIECVDVSPECYAAVGRSMAADHLIVAQITGSGKRRNRTVRVTITLFDVGATAPVRVIEELYKSDREAQSNIKQLVERVAARATTVAADQGGTR